MPRRKPKEDNGPSLYQRQALTTERRFRRQRALFIPRFVAAEAANQQLATKERDAAFQAVCRWADLETKGHLAQHKETSIDTQFLDQLFVDGLGYSLKTRSPSAWQLEHKFTVPGVGTADAALGLFPDELIPRVVIELKDATADLDRDRYNGRTPVQQCWDYLNALPECQWGIVSNFSAIRLYHKSKGSFAYEEFTLQELREPARFNEFYCIFQRDGLLPSRAAQRPRAVGLLEKTGARQKEVGDDLYAHYNRQRIALIDHFMRDHKKPLDSAIRIAQKLLDRVIFIAFCEDRGLLPDDCLEKAERAVPAFSKATNPKWHNLLALFDLVDKGGNEKLLEIGFNGGLFAKDAEIDDLDLFDEPWAVALTGFGNWDFSEEVNVEVLGHLFEKSIVELEKLRVGGLFALKAATNGAALNSEAKSRRASGNGAPAASTNGVASKSETRRGGMPKSAQRKRFGIYYTPPELTGLIVENTVDRVVDERFAALRAVHKVDPESREGQDSDRLLKYWKGCLESLQSITICDPACGSGAFLIRAYDALDAHYKTVLHGLAGAGLPADQVRALEDSIPDLILEHNLFGVDLSREAVEITQLALWIRSARRGKTLTDLSRHLICGNSLVSDKSVDPKALDWARAFPTIFTVPPIPSSKSVPSSSSGGFTCVIGNPPWERVKLQEREFFSLTDPATAEAVSAADRRKRIAALPKTNPELHERYLAAQTSAQKMLDYARDSGRFPLTGKSDINLYMLFAELARSIVAPDGVAGLLVPSGIATDDTTKEFFQALIDNRSLIVLYDFENRERLFPDVDGRFKFCTLVFGGASRRADGADFVFFAHQVEEVAPSNTQRHIPLTAADIALVNPNTRTCPIFRTRRDAEITKSVYRRVPILIDENRNAGGNPWGIRFFTMFHQTNDAEHFHPAPYWQKKRYTLRGNAFERGKARALPLYEAKMVQAFDHRAASVLVEKENWVRQGQKEETSPVEHQNPEFTVTPRWWVDVGAVDALLKDDQRPTYLAYKDVTSPTNERTMIAAFVPKVALVNSAPLLLTGTALGPRRDCCLLANLNAFAYDFVARQKVGGVHLNFFIVEQLPALPPDTYADKCPWSPRETLEHWISERVLKLSCTADDMKPLAAACGFKGSQGDGVHKWKDQERAHLRAELDAAYFHLYGISRDEAEYILSTFTNTGYNGADAAKRGEPLWDPHGSGAMILHFYDEYGTANRL